jgi:hypothetical protein
MNERARERTTENPFSEIQREIVEAPARVAEDMERSGNSWIAAFANRAQGIGGNVSLLLDKASLSPERRLEITSRVQALYMRVSEATTLYAERGIDPSPEAKEGLFNLLDVFKEDM